MNRAIGVTIVWAMALTLIVAVLAGCTRDRTDWAGISQAMKERHP